MSETLTFVVMAFSTLLFVMDPLGNLPLFITLTATQTSKQKRKTALRASVATFFILLVFMLFGTAIFRFFSLTIDAFRIAGGILLLLMALDMLRAQPSRTRSSPEETDAGVKKDDVAIVPLAIPLLAGPGTVASVMVYSNQHGDLPGILLLSGIILACCVITWLVFAASGPISRIISPSGIAVFERIMGLIVAALAIQFIADGVIGFAVTGVATISAGHASGSDAAVVASHGLSGAVSSALSSVGGATP